MRCLLIIPAYNEAENIEKVVDNIRNNYCFVSHPINLGIGGAVQTGYRYALKNHYDIAVQIDGDGQHDISYVEELIEPLIKGEADIAIGSRFITKEGFQSSASRRAGIFFLSKLIQCLCLKRVKDVTSGFRAVNKNYIRIYADNYPSDYPEPEAIVSALIHGGIVREIPVIMKERTSGKSSINLYKSVYYMIKVTLAILVCRISFGIRRGKRK